MKFNKGASIKEYESVISSLQFLERISSTVSGNDDILCVNNILDIIQDHHQKLCDSINRAENLKEQVLEETVRTYPDGMDNVESSKQVKQFEPNEFSDECVNALYSNTGKKIVPFSIDLIGFEDLRSVKNSVAIKLSKAVKLNNGFL